MTAEILKDIFEMIGDIGKHSHVEPTQNGTYQPNSWNSCLIYGKRYPCENIKEFQITKI